MNLTELPKDALVLLLDADSISYALIHQLAYKDLDDNKQMPEIEEVNRVIDDYINQLYSEVGASHVCGFLGGKGNFRYQVAKTKPYKGKRPEKSPFEEQWHQYIKGYLHSKFNYQFCDGIEADDGVSIAQTQLLQLGINYLICSNDKDVDTVWGNHYSMNKRIFYHITEEQASLLLHTQYITGDTTDNIPGLPGKGKVYAQRLLNDYTRIDFSIEENYARNVQWAYIEYGPFDSEVANRVYFLEQKTLLTLLKEHDSFVPLCYPIVKEKIESTLDLSGL